MVRSPGQNQEAAWLAASHADRSKDWITKTTLVRDYDAICIEDLLVKNMIRSARTTAAHPSKRVRPKAGLKRSISSQACVLCRQRLTDKATNCTSPVELVAPPA